MAINYGSGRLGDVTISTNTTLTGYIYEYNNLTINAGYTATFPSGSIILVKDTLTVNGIIKIDNNKITKVGGGPVGGTGAGAGGNGGYAGGNGTIVAKTIVGTGIIFANGGNGSVGGSGSNAGVSGTTSSQLPGLPGSPFSMPQIKYEAQSADQVSVSYIGGSNRMVGADVLGNDMSFLTDYLYNLLIPNIYIAGLADVNGLLQASGCGGSSGSSYPNGNYIQGASGNGGAGASFISIGGYGGASDGYCTQIDAVGTTTRGGSGGGGGGGAGGILFITSESLSSNITLESIGGNGGNGGQSIYAGTYESRAGGGGGGAGGLILTVAQSSPTVLVSGGSGGLKTNKATTQTSYAYATDGSAGGNGESIFIPISRFL